MTRRKDLHRLVAGQKYNSVEEISRYHVKKQNANIVQESRFLHATAWIPHDSVKRYLFSNYLSATFYYFRPRNLINRKQEKEVFFSQIAHFDRDKEKTDRIVVRCRLYV